ncbi:hypothetical protein [Croceiramulus getboli]|nr:hypothetical protein P8624_08860 [Flavobacteriaceae bacterium YJPT1-3]
MKTMYLFALYTVFATLMGCQVEPMLVEPSNPLFTKAEESAEVTYEIHLHHTALTYTLADLEARKKALQLEIENGNDEAIPQLEEVQQEINTSEEYLNFTWEMIGVLPVPPPPKPIPCDYPEQMNCPVPTPKSRVATFQEQGADGFSFSIVSEEGEVLYNTTDFDSCENDGQCYTMEYPEAGNYYFVVEKFFEPAGQTIQYQLRIEID